VNIIPGSEADNSSKFIAYSLGDFCSSTVIPNNQYGIILKLSIGETSSGMKKIGKIAWEYTHCSQFDDYCLTEINHDFTNVFEIPDDPQEIFDSFLT